MSRKWLVYLAIPLLLCGLVGPMPGSKPAVVLADGNVGAVPGTLNGDVLKLTVTNAATGTVAITNVSPALSGQWQGRPLRPMPSMPPLPRSPSGFSAVAQRIEIGRDGI